MQSFDRISRNRGAQWALLGAVSVCAVSSLWAARMFFQDDAFIHLRIARSLVDLGFYSFNGDRPAYCTSSLLYTTILAVASRFSSSPLLPKIIGIMTYAGLFSAIAMRFIAAPNARARALYLVFLAAVASPLGVRWLADGMETGLAGLLALGLAAAAVEICSSAAREGSPVRYGAPLYLVLGMAATTLRIEFGFIISLIVAGSLLQFGRIAVNRLSVSLALGGLLGLAAIYEIFGTLLPDTAIAKSQPAAGLPAMADLVASLSDAAKAHVAASSFGVLILGSWLLSAAWAIRHSSWRRFAWVVNAGLPVLIVLIAWHQQAIQGYRYFVFIEFFLLYTNIRLLDSVPASPVVERGRSPSARWIAAAIIFAAGGVWQAFDLYRLDMMSKGRGASFERFEKADFADLKDTYGVAWDVGLIGYFSQAKILDVCGLVDGRDVARMSRSERLRLFASSRPIRFVFANAAQLEEIRGIVDLRDWVNRGSFDFPNFGGNLDRHFLLVRPN
jgi:hypothetical protein